MATLSNSKGLKMIQFRLDATRPRQTIRLGRVSDKVARGVLHHIEHLVERARFDARVPPSTMEWLLKVDDAMFARLVSVGLAAPRANTNLGPLCEQYLERRIDLSPSARANIKQACDSMIAFFGYDRPVSQITRAHAADWRRQVGKAPATVAMYVKKARQVFQDAVDRKLVAENPFAGLKVGSMSNPARMRFVSADDVRRIMEHCPSIEWRLLFAFARWGGLRIPSEITGMTWSDINLATRRIVVRSPKTKHHEGGEQRVIPIFPELEAPLLDAFELVEGDGPYVFPSLRGRENPRRRALQIMKKAGITPWPKVFQNMRSTRQTELEETFPSHVVCRWMGNTQAVSRKHYLQVTDEHFARAAFSAAQSAAQPPPLTLTAAEQNPASAQTNHLTATEQCPRWDANLLLKALENYEIAADALLKALQQRQEALS
jgi:integrase